MEAPKRNYEAVEGVTVDYPLMWKPYCWSTHEEVKAWGIELPRLYSYGFPHNNCGGRCVKQGKAEWLRLKYNFPERFEEVKEWELTQRAQGDARENYALLRDQRGGILKPMTLAELELSEQPEPGEPSQEDLFSCFCSY